MNLLFIYGPPATGKLTVAKELSKVIHYPIFHNHMTRDLVESIYPENVAAHYELVHTLREDIMEYCAIHNTNLIFTFVYDGPEDDKAVAKKVESIRKNGGKVLFIELTAPHTVLLERVTNDSRKQHRKIDSTKLLSSLLKTKAYSSVPYENIFKIDTSLHTPQESAKLISNHFELV